MTNHIGTVEVPAHDLHRLLLSFRTALESGRFQTGTWHHAADYDWSFERLADIIDQYRTANGWDADPRTRCQRTVVYQWPDTSTPVRWVSIRASSRGRIRHLAAGGRICRTLCGFAFAPEDVIRRPRAVYRACEVCEREQRLQGVALQEPADAAG